MIKIGIVDDHAIVRSGLRQFFSEHVDLRVVGEAANGREAIDLVRAQEIDVLVMDLSMPGQSGLDALAMLRAKAPDMGILILSGYPEEACHQLDPPGRERLPQQGMRPQGDRRGHPCHCPGAPLFDAGRGRAAGAAAQPQGRRAAAQQLSEREFQVFLKLAPGLDGRGHRQVPVAQRQDREHLPHAAHGEDGAVVQQRPHLLRAQEQADRLTGAPAAAARCVPCTMQ